jgi:Forkhead domain
MRPNVVMFENPFPGPPYTSWGPMPMLQSPLQPHRPEGMSPLPHPPTTYYLEPKSNRPDPYVGNSTAPYPPESMPTDRNAPPREHSQSGGGYGESETSSPTQGHRPGKRRRRAPKPYSSYAIMLADIISRHPRRKMTLQEIYELLRHDYSYFSDEPSEDARGGWRVFST